MQNFMQIPPRGTSRQMGEIYAKIFPATYLFFRNSPTGQTLRPIFARDGSNDAVSRKDVPLGVKKFESNI